MDTVLADQVAHAVAAAYAFRADTLATVFRRRAGAICTTRGTRLPLGRLAMTIAAGLPAPAANAVGARRTPAVRRAARAILTLEHIAASVAAPAARFAPLQETPFVGATRAVRWTGRAVLSSAGAAQPVAATARADRFGDRLGGPRQRHRSEHGQQNPFSRPQHPCSRLRPCPRGPPRTPSRTLLANGPRVPERRP